jgi:hypothetical protein
MFKIVTNEEGKRNLNCDLQILNEQVVKKKLVVDKLKQGHVGRLRKIVGCNVFVHHQ